MPLLQIVYNRSDTKVVYSSPVTGNNQAGTEIAVLTTTIAPVEITNKIIIRLNITFETSAQENNIFRLVRSVPGLPDVFIGNNTTDGGRWSGWGMHGYDADNNSTPVSNHYILIDTPGTKLPVTYKFLTASTIGTAGTLFLNRSIGAVGQDIFEVGISQVILQEIS